MHDNISKLATQTPDLVLERQEQLRELFPEAWSEGALDFSKLRTLLGDLSDESDERYRFGWAGKRESLQLLQTPSRAALHPAPDESLDWDATQNLFIEGDNLEALKLLYKPLFNRVKMIYIDPPYNTGNDFIYPDNFADPLKNYLIQTGQKDPNGDLQTTNPDTAGRIHSRWLSMLYPRLTLARSLLRDDGVIFVSIDDNEVHHLRLLMNEVFGEENFLADVTWEKRFTRSNNARLFASVKDTIVVFRRSEAVSSLKEARTEKSDSIYSNPDADERGVWTSVSYVNPATKAERQNLTYKIENPFTGEEVEHETNAWKFGLEQHQIHVEEKRLYWGQSGGHKYPRLKKFLSEVSEGIVPVDVWSHKDSGTTDEGSKELNQLIGQDTFDNPKPTRLIKRMLQIATSVGSNDIILDFFSGSGTTGQAVLELNREDGGNRRFVLVQLPEKTGNPQFPTIADIGKERIRRVVARMKEQPLLDTRDTPEDLGFKVWKLGESNFRQMKRVDPKDTAAYLEQLELMNDAMLPDSDPQSVRYEVALREGFGLNCALEPVAGVEGADVWKVSDAEKGQHFFLSLNDTLALESLRPLKLSPDDLFICRGIALDDDTAANLTLQCRLKMI